MGRSRGNQDTQQILFVGWARADRYADWQQRAQGDNWRETFLALAASVGVLDNEDDTDLTILPLGQTPPEE